MPSGHCLILQKLGTYVKCLAKSLRDATLPMSKMTQLLKNMSLQKSSGKKSSPATLRVEVLSCVSKTMPTKPIQMTIQDLSEVQTYALRFFKIRNQIIIKSKSFTMTKVLIPMKSMIWSKLIVAS